MRSYQEDTGRESQLCRDRERARQEDGYLTARVGGCRLCPHVNVSLLDTMANLSKINN